MDVPGPADWFDGGGSGSKVDAAALLDSEAQPMLTALIAAGALVSLGLTSDGGALGLTITVDGRWRREWFRESEALQIWLEQAMAPVLAACEDRDASSAKRGRSRGPRDR